MILAYFVSAFLPVAVTFYHAIPAQTDASPCIGAALIDVCNRLAQGEKIIALSQELVGRHHSKPFHYGDRVLLVAKERECQGIFTVLDAMHHRWKNRADILLPAGARGTNCRGKVRLLPRI